MSEGSLLHEYLVEDNSRQRKEGDYKGAARLMSPCEVPKRALIFNLTIAENNLRLRAGE
jgi:hypothetical protein